MLELVNTVCRSEDVVLCILFDYEVHIRAFQVLLAMEGNRPPSAPRGCPREAPGLTDDENENERNDSQPAPSSMPKASIGVKVKTLAGADHQFTVPDISVRQFKAHIAPTLVNNKVSK